MTVRASLQTRPVPQSPRPHTFFLRGKFAKNRELNYARDRSHAIARLKAAMHDAAGAEHANDARVKGAEISNLKLVPLKAGSANQFLVTADMVDASGQCFLSFRGEVDFSRGRLSSDAEKVPRATPAPPNDPFLYADPELRARHQARVVENRRVGRGIPRIQVRSRAFRVAARRELELARRVFAPRDAPLSRADMEKYLLSFAAGEDTLSIQKPLHQSPQLASRMKPAVKARLALYVLTGHIRQARKERNHVVVAALQKQADAMCTMLYAAGFGGYPKRYCPEAYDLIDPAAFPPR